MECIRSYTLPTKRAGLYLLSDDVDWRQMSRRNSDDQLVSHLDGSIWFYYEQDERVPWGLSRRRVGDDSGWLALGFSHCNHRVGIRLDGSLWHWREDADRDNKTFYEAEGLTLSSWKLLPHRFRPKKIGMLDPKLWR